MDEDVKKMKEKKEKACSVLWSKIKEESKRSDSSILNNGPINIWVCFDRHYQADGDRFSWYQINPEKASDDDDAPPPTFQLPKGLDFNRINTLLVADESKLYVIGSPYEEEEDQFTTTDLSSFWEYSIPCDKLIGRVPMPTYKMRFDPLVVAVDGKIYFVGDPHRSYKSKSWGEVFESESSEWLDLGDFPVPDTQINQNLYIKERKEFLVNIYFHWWCFSTTDHTWREVEPAPDHIPVQLFYNGPAKVVVGDILYTFQYGVLHAFDLTTKINSHVQIHGLKDETIYLDHDFTKTFLFHFGKTTFCLVWCVSGFEDKQQVCFLTFNIAFPKGNKRPPRAVVHRSASYLFPGFLLFDCAI